MRRHLVFLHYDPEGYVDNAVLHTLRGFRPHVEKIFVVVNGFLDEQSRQRLDGVADEVMERENIGFDIGAYRAAFGRIGYGELAKYDELLLVNYTFLGPVGSFDSLFERMGTVPVDFWGMTDHIAMTPHPIAGVGTMPQHLQSYWIAIRKRMLASADFREYWSGLKNAHSYNDVIIKFETQFTKHFADLGYTWKSAYGHERYGTLNASMEAPLAQLDDGCPIFKRRIFFHDAVDRDHAGLAAAEVAKRAIELGYPRDVLIDGIYRRTPSRQLSAALDGYLVLPEQAGDSAYVGSKAVVNDDENFWKSWLRDGQNVFEGASYLIRTGNEFDAASVHAALRAAHSRAFDVIVRQPAGIVNAFDQDDRLGFVVPLVEHRSTDALGKGYAQYGSQVHALADLLGIRPPLEPDAPLTPVLGISALRSDAFASLPQQVAAAGGWDSLASSMGGDRAMSDLLDLLAADIARSNGFYTAQATTAFQLRVSHSMLEQKFSRLSSRFGPGPQTPFKGPLRSENGEARAAIARAIKRRAPKTAARMGAAERKAKSTVKRLAQAFRRCLGRVVK